MSSDSTEDTDDIYVVNESKNERLYKDFGSEDSTMTLKKSEENVFKTANITPENVFLGRKVDEVPFNFSQRLSIGGPFSAFSSFENLDLKYGISKEASRTLVPRDAPFLSLGSASEIPHLRFGTRPDFPPTFPIPPAFAQIFQRRKRRETRPRRQRTTFTSEQTMKLEMEYNRAEYITRPRRFELAELLSLSENQIKIWFQNRRAKDKRIEKAQMDQQLRVMSCCGIPGALPIPISYSSFCGPCLVPPTSFPATSPSFAAPTKPVAFTCIYLIRPLFGMAISSFLSRVETVTVDEWPESFLMQDWYIQRRIIPNL